MPSLLQPFDITEAPATTCSIGGVSATSTDNERENSGKKSSDRVPTPETDRKTSGGANSTPQATSAEPSKVGEVIPIKPAQATDANANSLQNSTSPANVVQSAGNTEAHRSDPIHTSGRAPNDEAMSPNIEAGLDPATMHSAHFVSQIAKSDVRITLPDEQFGNIELHAKMNGDQLSASITVEHRETHALLSGDLPVLHQLLNERHLQVSEIVLLHESLSSGGSADEGAHPQRGERQLQQGTGSLNNAGGETSSQSVGPTEQFSANAIFDSKGRLNVQA